MSLIPPEAPAASLPALDERARDIFRKIVESYLQTGEPVGSRTLSRAGIELSPASIRNTMQDLTAAGLLAAPHTSAGRLPTHAGLRLFVDGLLEIGDVGEDEKREIEARLVGRGRNFQESLDEASAILSGLAGGAGVVVTPARDAGVKHVEFVQLGGDQTLAVMVFDDGTVENRLMPLPQGLTPSALQEASNFLNARLRGRTLAEAKTEMRGELERARSALNETAARLVEDGLAAWSGGDGDDRALLVRGRANLLQDANAAADLERVRSLFDDLEQKQQLIGLLDNVREAQGVRIFIGAETRLFSLSGSAVIAAPYMTGRQRVVGAIGVIGPARLNYARVIPLVDYTARVLGGACPAPMDEEEMSFSDDSRPLDEADDAVLTEDEDGSGRDLEAENAALREQALRYAAEAENTKRRAEREANDARAYAIQRFGRDLLGAADNLSRALMAVPQSDDPAVKNFVLGIEMTARELDSAFDKNGLKKVEPGSGDKFDPNLHQAMMEEPAAGVGAGAVVRTLQPGYTLHGRIVRPALVVTAARSAAAEAAAAPASAPAEGASAYAQADGAGAGAAVDRRA